jgi:fibronectin-binding autotransporter adhesin
VSSLLPNSVVVDAATDYVFTNTAGSIDGTAGLTKTNAGTLSIQTINNYIGVTTFGGGVLEVSQLTNGDAASPIGSASLDPANLVFHNGTLRYTGSDVSIDRGATFLGTNGVMDVTNSATTLTLTGTLVGGGTLTKAGEGNLIVSGASSSYSGGTILNAGTLTINSALGAGSGAITLNAGNLALGAVKPANPIVAVGGSISGGNAGGLTGIRNVTGSSNLNLSVTTGVFDLNGNMTAYSGTITFINAGGGTVRFNGATGSELATWDLGAGPMDLNIRSSSAANNFGALKGGASTTLSGRSSSDNNGPTTHYIGANGQSTTFDGVIRNGALANQLLAIVKVGGGTLTLSGASTYTGSTTISNGVLALSGDGSIGGTANIYVVAGTVLDVSARNDGTLTLNNNQLLRGNGTIRGSVTANSGSTVSPGTSIGLLTITNVLTLISGSATVMELDATAGTNDVIAVQGGVTYGGTLQIKLVNGTLAAGQIYKLFNAPSGQYSGSFDGGVSPASTNGLTWDTSKLTVDGTLKVIVATKPVIGNISISGSDLSFSGNNGIPNASFNLLSSTDVTLPLSSWTVVGAYTFDGSGNFSFTLSGAFDPNQPQVFYSVQY